MSIQLPLTALFLLSVLVTPTFATEQNPMEKNAAMVTNALVMNYALPIVLITIAFGLAAIGFEILKKMIRDRIKQMRNKRR